MTMPGDCPVLLAETQECVSTGLGVPHQHTLYYIGHLLEGVAPDASLTIVENQMAIIFHFHQLALELAVSVSVGMKALAPIESQVIEGGHVSVSAVPEHLAIPLKGLHHLLGQLLPVYLPAQQLAKRYWIGRITTEHRLVHIDAHAKDTALQLVLRHRGFYQGATEFAVAHIHVVRPLQGHVLFHVAGNRVFHGQPSRHREEKLRAHRHIAQMHPDAHQQVLARLALPSVSALATAMSLVVGHHHQQGVVSFVLWPESS